MIVLYVLGAVLLLLLFVLLLPLCVEVKFCEEFVYKVKFAGVKVYPQSKKVENKEQKEATEEKPAQKGMFQKLKEKRGFVGAIKELFAFFTACLLPLKKFLGAVKFKKVKVNLTVSGADAAQTAIDYGIACSVVYPVLSLFKNITKAKYKKIDIKTDFEGTKSSFDFSLDIKMQLLFVLIFAFKIYKEYKKFSVRNDLQ